MSDVTRVAVIATRKGMEGKPDCKSHLKGRVRNVVELVSQLFSRY
jgi:hypothetical protein